MSRKVRNKQYRTKSEFVADLNLIWDNCLNYNANPVRPSSHSDSDTLANYAMGSHILSGAAQMPFESGR